MSLSKKSAFIFGHVREISREACSPCPEISPSSTCQPLGMSMLTMGVFDSLSRSHITSKGARISPENPNPKIPSNAMSRCSPINLEEGNSSGRWLKE